MYCTNIYRVFSTWGIPLDIDWHTISLFDITQILSYEIKSYEHFINFISGCFLKPCVPAMGWPLVHAWFREYPSIHFPLIHPSIHMSVRLVVSQSVSHLIIIGSTFLLYVNKAFSCQIGLDNKCFGFIVILYYVRCISYGNRNCDLFGKRRAFPVWSKCCKFPTKQVVAVLDVLEFMERMAGWRSITRKTKGRQFDNFVVTGGIISCNDNLRCHQWPKSCQIGDM